MEGADEANVLFGGNSINDDATSWDLITAIYIHVECHGCTNYGGPPLVPERPILRVSGVIWTVPGHQVWARVRFGEGGQWVLSVIVAVSIDSSFVVLPLTRPPIPRPS